MRSLLASVANSFVKVDILAHLYRHRFRPEATASISRALECPAGSVAEALSALLDAGVIRTSTDDGAGWWFDPNSTWADSIELMVDLYDVDRGQLLRLMRAVGIYGADGVSVRVIGGQRRVLPKPPS